MSDVLLSAENLHKYFPLTRGLVFTRTAGYVQAVDGLDFIIRQGETLGLVGESGCGKTTTAKLLMRLETPTEGRIVLDGKDIQQLNAAELRGFRRTVQAVFQDPWSSLSPLPPPLCTQSQGQNPTLLLQQALPTSSKSPVAARLDGCRSRLSSQPTRRQAYLATPAPRLLASLSSKASRLPRTQSTLVKPSRPKTSHPSACKDGRVRHRNLCASRHLSPHLGTGEALAKMGVLSLKCHLIPMI